MDITTEVHKLLRDEFIEEKKEKEGLVTYIRRIVEVTDKTQEQDEKHYLVSDIKRIKVTKIGTEGIKSRMNIPKFGVCESQKRGVVEGGTTRIDNEVKITNRKKAVYQEGLKERLKQSTVTSTKEALEEKMLDEIERKRKENIAKISSAPDDFKKKKPREAKETDIKITGFNMRCDENDLMNLFENVGPVKKCIILRDRVTNKKRNIAFLEFRETYHVELAIEKYNNKTVGGCVLIVCRPADDE